MNAEDFVKSAYENKDVFENKDKDYYGICPPPTNAQVGMNILINHFLGEDWYVTLPLNTEQVNTEAIYQILKLYSNENLKKESNMLRKFITYIGRKLGLSIINPYDVWECDCFVSIMTNDCYLSLPKEKQTKENRELLEDAGLWLEKYLGVCEFSKENLKSKESK